MAEKITVATTVLRDISTATADIDNALTIMMKESRPVYIGVPTDVAWAPVSDETLKNPIPRTLKNDKAMEDQAISVIRSLIEKAQRPVIIVDGGNFHFKVMRRKEIY
jgi:pyruvate decarboxylase